MQLWRQMEPSLLIHFPQKIYVLAESEAKLDNLVKYFNNDALVITMPQLLFYFTQSNRNRWNTVISQNIGAHA